MALGTVGRQIQGRVARIGALVVVGLVAAHTGGGRAGIIAADVAFATRHRSVRPCQRPDGVVVEGRRCPSRLIVALDAICRQLIGHVVGVGGRIVVRLVASHAGIGRVVVISSNMTEGTIVGDGGVRPRQWIEVVMDGEGCRCPARFGGVALGTVGRQV